MASHQAQPANHHDEWVNFGHRMRPEMASKLDQEAEKLGINRRSLMNIIIAKHFGEF